MPRRATTTRTVTPDALEQAAECLRTLAHPARLRIVELLLDDEYTVGEIAEAVNITPSHASTHLGRMRDRGLLRVERRGREVYYSVAEPALEGILGCIRKRFGGTTAR